MNLLFKDLFGIFKIFEDVYERVRKILIPTTAYSWQTFIYLSVFSWVMSYFATGYIRDIIALCGWLFLIAGTAWYTTDDPLRVPGTFMPVGAVITGFLVSVFAFSNQEDVITSRTVVLWPTISALITAIPEFIEGSDTDSKTRIPKPDARQKIIVLVASCMMISCWLQFYFVLDKWLQEYPSLLAENFGRSTFVITREEQQKIPTNGVVILDRLQPLVEEQIAERPWSEVERWLLEANVRVGQLGREVLNNNLAQYEEKALWRVEPRVVNNKSGYRLDLLSIWTGPTANPRGYFLRKSCQIDPVATTPINTTTNSRTPEEKKAVAEIQCDRLNKLFSGAAPPQQ
ncbi:filament integrity protein FraD [Anabaena sp. CCY 9910]|uniref:filament integrity protein FraD n=1 Tax=Anabaena sp. CCY 9910 TaxID=3103870 RepID=UPI0039E1790D